MTNIGGSADFILCTFLYGDADYKDLFFRLFLAQITYARMYVNRYILLYVLY